MPFTCPCCGEPTDRLHDGYCEPCWSDRQAAVDMHRIEFTQWQSMTDKQRTDAIRRATR